MTLKSLSFNNTVEKQWYAGKKKLAKKRKDFKNCTENQTCCENDIFLLSFKDIQ